MPLTAEKIENAKPGVASDGRATLKPYKMGDSAGLYLEVQPSGGKLWRMKYRFARREKRIALGSYPIVSLLEARNLRDRYRKLLADGLDPGEVHKLEKTVKRAEEARQIAATRFTLDNDGSLSFRFGNRHVSLSPTEAVELLTFLDGTREVIMRAKPCL